MNGIVYVAYGAKAKSEAQLSIKSLRRFTDMPVTVIDETVFNNPGPGARWAKLNMDTLVNYDQVLYLDADTRINEDVTSGFELLDNWDLAIAPSKNQGNEIFKHIQDSDEKQETLHEIGNWFPIQLQCGVMLFDRLRCAKLFSEWRNQWQRWQGQDQAALLRALAIEPVRVWLLGKCWNSEDGTIVQHLFGRV